MEVMLKGEEHVTLDEGKIYTVNKCYKVSLTRINDLENGRNIKGYTLIEAEYPDYIYPFDMFNIIE
jgi:hypothetical protein